MAIIDYEKGVLFMDGAVQIRTASFKLENDPKWQPVETMQGGLSGFSPGAESATWDVEGFIPRAGYEYDYLSAMQSGKNIEMTFFAAGKKETAKGRMLKLSRSFGVNDTSKVSFTVMTVPTEQTTL